jgi:hypothetical protein
VRLRGTEALGKLVQVHAGHSDNVFAAASQYNTRLQIVPAKLVGEEITVSIEFDGTCQISSQHWCVAQGCDRIRTAGPRTGHTQVRRKAILPRLYAGMKCSGPSPHNTSFP